MITLYTTHCPRCIVLEKKLTAKGIEFEICEDQDLMVEKGFMSAPMLEVDNEVLDFTKAVAWINNK